MSTLTRSGDSHRRASLGAIAVAASALVMLVGCTANERDGASPAVTATDAGIAEITAPTSASVPMARPSVAVGYEISDPHAVTVVVTKLRQIDPIDFAPADLVSLNSVPGGEGQQLRAEAAAGMTSMYEAAVAAGAAFHVLSAYRAYEFQQSLYAGYVAEIGQADADRVSARPGFSEHQTGLAADVYDVEANSLKASFGTSTTGEWLAANAYRHGYIISYAEGKEAVTGYTWEPWHVRYVGVSVATQMHDQGVVTLQEFMGVEDSPGYE